MALRFEHALAESAATMIGAGRPFEPGGVMRVCSHYRLAARARIVASMALALGAGGPVSCYTAGANPAARPNPVSREVLPIDENSARYLNLYDAIEHLRPEYLRMREQGPGSLLPVAYLDGVRLADPTMLRLVPVSTAIEVRWVRPNQTSPLYLFSHHIGGGIFVRTK